MKAVVATLACTLALVAAVPQTPGAGGDASFREAAPDQVVAWVRSNAVPLRTVEAGHGLEDMEPLRGIVGDARVVALGEATHGTREFFQMKHRMLEFLVERMGFTVFAIEANWPESLALDEYVASGSGDPEAGLAGLYFWTWQTQEVLDLVKWMRAWNADPAHARKLRFYGFDMQAPYLAAQRVRDYLRLVDPARADRVEQVLAPALRADAAAHLRGMDASEQQALLHGAGELLAAFDAKRDEYSRATGAARFDRARQHLVIVRQAVEMIAAGATAEAGEARDRAMAGNVRWLLDQEPAGTRMVVWAHNFHVSRCSPPGRQERPMGAFLAEALGRDFVSFGFVFGRGSFQAIDWTLGRHAPGTLEAHAVGRPPDHTIEAAFERSGQRLFALDLRPRAGGSEPPAWFSQTHAMREIGAVHMGDPTLERAVQLARAYDAVFFVARTSRAVPLRRVAPSTLPMETPRMVPIPPAEEPPRDTVTRSAQPRLVPVAPVQALSRDSVRRSGQGSVKSRSIS